MSSKQCSSLHVEEEKREEGGKQIIPCRLARSRKRSGRAKIFSDQGEAKIRGPPPYELP
jgi:hypothetical protein